MQTKLIGQAKWCWHYYGLWHWLRFY